MAAPAPAHHASHHTHFDENASNALMDLQSRTAAAVGLDTLKNLSSLNVLVIGVKGVGVETAKNLILTGLRSVILNDNDLVQIQDLSSNFYLRPEDVGKNTLAEASLSELASLNPLGVKVSVYNGQVTLEYLKEQKIGAVVVTKTLRKADLVALNNMCREIKATFVLAVTHGLTGTFFSDFGARHVVTDKDGEPKKTLIVEDISDDYIVTVALEQGSHDLEDGSLVTFEEVEGADLNKKTFKIGRVYKKVTDFKTNKTRSVLDTNKIQLTHVVEDGDDDAQVATAIAALQLGKWTKGGIITEVKTKIILNFRSLIDSLTNPVVNTNLGIPHVFHPEQMRWMMGTGSQVHYAFHATLHFLDQNGQLPRLHNSEDAANLVRIAKELLSLEKEKPAQEQGLVVDEIDESVITKFSLYARTELSGYAAFLGGVAAQEVQKRFGKFSPMWQWMHVDHFELLGDAVPADAQPLGSRYDNLIALFGKNFQDAVSNQKWFLVGAGALGCEYLKAFAMMGLGCGSNGRVFVTDMDRIELSNLSRQFLFRQHHVGKPKSVSAAAAAQIMNPDLKVTTYEVKVCDETEDIFDDEFWSSLDGVWNALDNVAARRYTDSKCLFYSKPLLESGTQGTKANSEVILPKQTTSYADHKEQETGGIPMCTLQNFPHLIEHCIEWARPQFEELFEQNPKNFNDFVEDRVKFFQRVSGENTGTQKFLLSSIKALLEKTSNRSFEGCIQLAFEQFVRQYDFRIRDLTAQFPADARNIDKDTGADMGAFWSGHKRFPQNAAFDINNDAHLDYLLSASNLFAFSFGLDFVRDKAQFKSMVQGLTLTPPSWKAAKVSMHEKEQQPDAQGAAAAAAVDVDERDEIKQLIEELSAVDVSKVAAMRINDFEKDDDTNFHIDFITIAANMRAFNYHIKETTRFQCKLIAGRIIPALATTTAMVTGLVQLEFFKLLKGLKADAFFNSNVNLALSSFNFFAPQEPHKKTKSFDPVMQAEIIAVPDGYTSWDWVVIDNGDLTVGEFLETLTEQHHGVEAENLYKFGISQKDISDGKGKLLWVFGQQSKLNRKLSELYIETYGPFLNPKRTWILLEGSFADADSNGVSIPTIKYIFKH